MKKLKNWILGWILFHANRHKFLDTFDYQSRLRNIFYEIKNQILAKYGKPICYDLQVIDLQECWTCDGTGMYKKYNHYHNYHYKEACWSCAGTGAYKDGSVIVLAKIQLGKYSFHQPKLRTFFEKQAKKEELIQAYKAMYETDNHIEGYINKKSTGLSLLCLYLLFRLNDKKQTFWDNLVIWWRTNYWLPQNYLHNVFYLIKNKRRLPEKSQLLYVFQYLKNKYKNRLRKKKLKQMIIEKEMSPQLPYQNDDLPF